MSPAARRAAIVIAGVAVLVVAFLLLGKGSSTTGTTNSARAVVISGGKPKGGVQKLSFKQGSTARFTVTSDTADEIHVHGYDIHEDVAKGGSVTFAFPAKLEGRFVVELEGKGELIAQLDVVP
jgi:hypothetical protein